jgi:hypothetical protein
MIMILIMIPITIPTTFNNYSSRLYVHCNDRIPKIRNKYSQKSNRTASVPISTFTCLWAIYIFPRSVCLFCCRKICGPIQGIYKSLTDTWMWKFDCGRALPFLGIHKWDFGCSVLWTFTEPPRNVPCTVQRQTRRSRDTASQCLSAGRRRSSAPLCAACAGNLPR